MKMNSCPPLFALFALGLPRNGRVQGNSSTTSAVRSSTLHSRLSTSQEWHLQSGYPEFYLMSTACETVFSILELLETILLHLPQCTLFHAQRVNRTFHTLIINSPAIQQALFFRAKPTTGQLVNYEQNALLCQSFPDWFQLRSSSLHRFAKQMRRDAFDRLDWNQSEEKKRAYARRDASWRRMLVLQPPATLLEVKGHVHAMGGDSERVGNLALRDPRLRASNVTRRTSPNRDLAHEGLTMGLLYDMVELAVMGESNSFWLEWNMFPAPMDDKDSRRHAISTTDTVYPGEHSVMKPARFTTGSEDFNPQASITLYLSRTISCVRRIGPPPNRLQSDAAEKVDVNFTEWRTCARWR